MIGMTMAHKVDLTQLTQGKVRNLAGHDRGLSAREHFNLDQLDGDEQAVEIFLPDDFRSVSPSFFEGMFSRSVASLKGIDEFLGHYRFNAPAHIRTKLIEYATRSAKRHATHH